jgi:hypothetical protein
MIESDLRLEGDDPCRCYAKLRASRDYLFTFACASLLLAVEIIGKSSDID